MTLLDEIKEKVAALSDADFARLREWLDEHDEAVWDRQLEEDYKAGPLDAMIAQARKDDEEGNTTPL